MSYDNSLGGSYAAHDCRDQAIADQCGLCAYCEREITSHKPLQRRIEHFHPKSDRSEARNWGLDWENMLAVCDGGSGGSQDEQKTHPLPKNLSCDAHKDRMIQIGNLPVCCEGYLLNPLDVPAFPNLFAFEKGSWRLMPDETCCASVNVAGNVYETTAELVAHTISYLNLNCERLTDSRMRLVYNIERNIKKLREHGFKPTDIPEKLVQRYFRKKWPEFFTTLRCLLGAAAEDYLVSSDFQG